MKGINKNIEEFVRNQLDNHEFGYDAGEWVRLKKNLPKPSVSVFTNPLFYVSSVFIILAVVSTLYFTDSFENKTVSSGENISEQTLLQDIVLPVEIEEDTVTGELFVEEIPVVLENNTIENDEIENLNSNENVLVEERVVEKPVLITKIQIPECKDPCALFNINSYEGCSPFEVILTPVEKSDSMVYLWDFGDGLVSTGINGKHNYTEPGIFPVTLTVKYFKSEKVVSYRLEQPVVVYPSPNADFTYEIINTRVKFTTLSNLNFSYSWDFGDGGKSIEINPEYGYNRSGDFRIVLSATSQNSCKTKVEKIISIEKEADYIMPDAFTPNGDGKNDFYGPAFRTTDLVQYEMLIFNKNGMIVYQTKDMNNPWDGKILGSNRLSEEGVYVYIIKTVDDLGNFQTKKGHFSLLHEIQ